MVHVRYNEKQANPNPHVNFTTPLPAVNKEDEAAALELLRSLAAQVKPIMKKHGFTVNSLEEYEFNQVFAGRNWNNGEVVELVLRRPDGTFYPTSYLLSTFCHELAHIKHMNHLPPFQALWAELRREVRALQARGYFGDGYWSAGHRVSDGLLIAPSSLPAADLPEYTCGGAQTAPRSKGLPRRRREARSRAGPSAHTGRQTERKRKAGGRVRREVFGAEEGNRVDGRGEGDRGEGSTFRKRATSQKAKEERAAAAEKRMRALQGLPPLDEPAEDPSDSEEEPDSDDDARRRAMATNMPKSEIDSLRTGTASTPNPRKRPKEPVIFDLTGDTDDEDDEGEELPDVSDMLEGDFVQLGSSSRAQVDEPPAGGGGKGKAPARPEPLFKSSDDDEPPRVVKRPRKESPKAPPAKQGRQAGLTNFVKDEIRQRTHEAIGLDQSRRLGGGSAPSSASAPARKKPDTPPPGGRQWACAACTFLNEPGCAGCEMCGASNGAGAMSGAWTCTACTFANEPRSSSCAMCETPKGRTGGAG